MTANLCALGATKMSTPFRSRVLGMPSWSKARWAAATASSGFRWLRKTRISPEVLLSASAIAATRLASSNWLMNALGFMAGSPASSRAAAAEAAAATGESSAAGTPTAAAAPTAAPATPTTAAQSHPVPVSARQPHFHEEKDEQREQERQDRKSV